MKKLLAVLFALGVALLSVGQVVAQMKGEGLFFMVRDGTPVHPEDLLLFTGRSQGITATGDCGNGEGHVYDATLVNPGGGYAARRVELIVLEPQDEVRPGTRVGSFEPVGVCFAAGGVLYQRYHSTVE